MACMVIVAIFWFIFLAPMLGVILFYKLPVVGTRMVGCIARLVMAFQPFKPAVGQADPIWPLLPPNPDTASSPDYMDVAALFSSLPEWAKGEFAALPRITEAELMEKISIARGEAAAFYKQGEYHVMVERREQPRPTQSIIVSDRIIKLRQQLVAKKMIGRALSEGPTGCI